MSRNRSRSVTAKRSAPSLTRNLLRIVLQKPGLARELPVNLLPDTAERPALLLLHRLVTANPESSSYASLREQIRGLPEEALFESFAAELLGNPFDEGEAETEFRATLEKLQEGDQKRAFDEFLHRMPFYGLAILCADDAETRPWVRSRLRDESGKVWNELDLPALAGNLQFLEVGSVAAVPASH